MLERMTVSGKNRERRCELVVCLVNVFVHKPRMEKTMRVVKQDFVDESEDENMRDCITEAVNVSDVGVIAEVFCRAVKSQANRNRNEGLVGNHNEGCLEL